MTATGSPAAPVTGPRREPSRARRLARRAALTLGLGRVTLAVAAVLTAKQLLALPLARDPRVGASTLVASVAGALFVVAFGLQWRGRAQLLALAAGDAVLTLLHQVNLVYYRQFSDLASVSSLSYAWQLRAVHGAVLDLLRPADLLLWIDVAILFVASASRTARVRARTSRPAAGWVGLASVVLLVGCAVRIERPMRGQMTLDLTRAQVASALNLFGYFFFDVYWSVHDRVASSAREPRHDRGAGSAGVAPDEAAEFYAARRPAEGALTSSARGLNVIVVQLESEQGFAVGRTIGGVKVTPVLDALAQESIAFPRFFSQAGVGRTSDAEFAGACSQLPLRTGPVFETKSDVDYECLPELLQRHGYTTVAMHANVPEFWNRVAMYRSLGYDRFFSERDFDTAPVVGFGLSDARFFEQAVEHMSRLPQPFYAMLVTLSCHPPFAAEGIPKALDAGEQAPLVARYLNALHYADQALGVLVERLRAANLLDRSLLVLYGDHEAVRSAQVVEPIAPDRRRGGAVFEFDRRVPLLIRLPHGAHAGVRPAPGSQLDLAPTVLDALGISARTYFHGRSLLSDAPRAVVFADGSAVDASLSYLSNEQTSERPGCFDADGQRVADERCEKLARDAGREISISRTMLEGNLFHLPEVAVGAARPRE